MRDILAALCIFLLLPFLALLWASIWLTSKLKALWSLKLTTLWFGEDDHAEGVR